ncbi:hypothetical protein D3C77_595180 [compost metagenome]
MPGAATWVIATQALRLLLPGSKVQFRQASAYLYALAARQLCITTAKHQLTTPLVKLVHGRGIEHVGDVCIAEVEASLGPLQGHTELAGTGFVGGLAERSRQIDCQALERGVDLKLVITTPQ